MLTKKTLQEFLLLSLGTSLVSIGVYFFKFPNHFSMGGVSGLSILLGELFSAPWLTPSTFNTLINIIFLALGFVVLDKGFDVLLLTEDVDEFCLQILHSYPRKDAEGKDGTVEFKNVNSGDLGLETEEEKKAAEDATAENKNLFDAMKDALDGKVKEVKVSTRLKDHPVCLSADGPLSIEMEKVLSKQPGSEGVKSDKVLELNVNHPVFAVLKAAQEAGDTDKLKKYSALLYAQAQLIEGLPVDDPAAYAEAVCSLMK